MTVHVLRLRGSAIGGVGAVSAGLPGSRPGTAGGMVAAAFPAAVDQPGQSGAAALLSTTVDNQKLHYLKETVMNHPQQPAWPTAWAPQQPMRADVPEPHQASPWANNAAPQPIPAFHPQVPRYAATPPAPYPGAGEPIFTVRLRKHTGLAVAFLNQSYCFTGTFHQCEAAIKQAQGHNLIAGWWSLTSILVLNWIALVGNANARRTLRRDASQYGYAPVAT